MSELSPVNPAPLIVASNRGPLRVELGPDGENVVHRGSGGLVSGLQAALSDTPGALWICAALDERERTLARTAPGGRLGRLELTAAALGADFDVRMLAIDAATFRSAYNGVANGTLWFVLHQLYDLPTAPVFDAAWRRQWAGYVRYNQAFAQALAQEAAPAARVMIQDYHLFLAPRMLRTLRPDLRIGHFTHTPWVEPDAFAVLPDDIAAELVEGLSGADVCGFHTQRWAELFARTAERVLGRRPGGIGVFPLGVDAAELRERAARRDVQAAGRRLAEAVGDRALIGRVDRTELSKNVWRGLLAYRELLRTRPEWHGRVVHAVYDNPSREDLPAYREYTAAIERLGAEIVDEFGTEDWSPLDLQIEDDYPGALAVLQRSDVLFVNSVRDGMNLVVLEGLVLSERSPAVVLSRETGAAEVLGADARLVNPFDVSLAAAALHEALSSTVAQRRAPAERMRAAAGRVPPAQWFQAQLEALDGPDRAVLSS